MQKRGLSWALALACASIQLSAADTYKATATLKFEIPKEVPAEEVRAFLDQVTDRPALDEIAARLALGTAWNLDADQTARKLAGLLEVSVDAAGTEGKIAASDESPVMAAIIANTASSVLRDRESKAGGKSMKHLEQAILRQGDVVEDRRKYLSQIIRAEGIVYRGDEKAADPEAPRPGNDDEVKTALVGQSYIDAKNDYEVANRLLLQLKEKTMKWEANGGLNIHHILWAKPPVK